MSLKAFHLLFISLAILLVIGFGVWSLVNYSSSNALLDLSVGIVSLLAAMGLIAYETWFLRRLKHVRAA